MPELRESLLANRFRYRRRLPVTKIPVGVRCYLGPDDADSYGDERMYFMGDYQWKPRGPKDFIFGSMTEAIEYDCTPSPGEPFEVTVFDWDQVVCDLLHQWQAAGQRLRLFAFGEDWIVGLIEIAIYRKSEKELKFIFRPMYGCRLAHDDLTQQQFFDPFLTGRSSIFSVGDTTHVTITAGAYAESWLVPGADIIILTDAGEQAGEVQSYNAGTLTLDSAVSGMEVGGLVYTPGQFYGAHP